MSTGPCFSESTVRHSRLQWLWKSTWFSLKRSVAGIIVYRAGYFGFSYFVQNPDALKALSVDGGSGCVSPSIETALSGDYAPLARPLFVYANVESFTEETVREFMRFYLENAPEIAEVALFVPLSEEQRQDALDVFEAAAASVAPPVTTATE